MTSQKSLSKMDSSFGKSNIFLIAKTKDGKTTVSNFLVEELGVTTISASKWVVPAFLAEFPYEKNPEVYSHKISKFSIDRLKKDPDSCIDVIKNDPSVKAGNCLIEGIRNPRDFLALFDARKDFVIRFEVETNIGNYSKFEQFGIQAIDGILDWYIACELIKPNQIIRFRLSDRENGVNLPITKNGEIPCRDLKEMKDILRKILV